MNRTFALLSRRKAAWIPLACAAALTLLAVAPALGLDPPAAPRRVRRNLQVEDFGTILRARTVTAPILYKQAQTGHIRFNCSLEACNGLTAADGMKGEEAPFQIFDLDLETGKAVIVSGRQGRTGDPILHSNGKLYYFTSRPPAILEFDPAAGTARDLGVLQPDNYYAGAQSRTEGPDGRLYLGMYGLHMIAFDPKTNKVEDFGDASSGDCKNGYVYHIGVDERYIHGRLMGYGATGMSVYDLKTRTMVHFTNAEYNQGLKTGVWQSKGKQVFADAPPKRVPFAPYRYRGRDAWEASNAKQAGLELDLTDIRPTDWNGGVITVRWRKPGEEAWREARTPGADLVPNTIKRLVPLPDGKLIGMSAFYGIIFAYDPATRTPHYLGPAPGSVYDILVLDGKVYMSGYSAFLAAFDPAHPWTYAKEDPRGKNPFSLNMGGKYNYFTAAGADGKVYVAGTHSRHSTGASLDCYDPTTRTPRQLLRQDLREHHPSDLVALQDGHLMVMGYGKQLVVYDVETQKLLRMVDLAEPVPGAGKLLAAGPDHVVGLVRISKKGEGDTIAHNGILYKVNVKTGETIYVKTIPGKVFSGQLRIEFKGEDSRFAAGPDGCGWLFVDNWLARVNPADGAVEKIREMDSRGRMFFVGNDLYIYNGGRQYFGGFAGILRIRGVFEN